MELLAILAMAFYFLAAFACVHNILNPQHRSGRASVLAALCAMALHGLWLFDIIVLVPGQNLSMLNVASLISLIIAALMTVLVARFKVWLLMPLVYGFAALLLAADWLIPSHYSMYLETRPEVLLHIGLGLMSYSLLAIASLLAILLGFLTHRLKSHKLTNLPSMPPLMTLERYLIRLIFIGVVVLTLSISSGLFFLQDMFGPGKAHKAILTIIAWCVYVGLLWGHYRLGWRGRKVIWASVVGSLLLTLAYFGSRFVREVLLG
ncbi:inner membrane protein YpjD [Oceanisphaera sp. IT1-181]|uniref:cytochrome C assembly family protein n=1 Tax=Oceanisphaera sp. IT1-181 TaxID=3081199 RepID=UPI0029CA7D6E|nr:cytochrome c biogenesis protein CcsA [Oceanisphaera sp. IT1-181]